MIEQIALDLEGADCTILVVDDDRDVRVYFQRVVKALGADIKLSTVESLGRRARGAGQIRVGGPGIHR